MKPIIRTVAGILALVSGIATGFSQNSPSPTSPALGFNVFLMKDAKLVNNETEGPIALGGKLLLAGGYQVATQSDGSFKVQGVPVTLVTGGTIIYESGTGLSVNKGYVKIGDCDGSYVWYKDPNNAFSPMRITPGQNYNGSPRIMLMSSSQTFGVSASNNPVCQANVIDFAAAFEQFKKTSANICNCDDNAVLKNSNGQVIPHTNLPAQVKIDLSNGTNVLKLSGTELNKIQDLIFLDEPDGDDPLVINVDAPGSFVWKVPNFSGISNSAAKHILINFCSTTELKIEGYGSVQGTIFAPHADVIKTVNKANIVGQVIAQSLIHDGGEIHYRLFMSDIPGCNKPTTSFTVNSTTQCAGTAFVFSNQSTGEGTLTYKWTFGDGTTSTAKNPSKTYNTPGTYTVTLTVTSPTGSSSMSMQVTVNPKPTKGFTISKTIQPVIGNLFTFTSSGNTSGNTYKWYFGDGTTSTDVNPTKTYTQAGAFIVKQVVTNSYGCKDSTTDCVYVESDEVGSGNNGGLESEGLGDVTAKRAFNRARYDVPGRVDYAALPEFKKSLFASGAKENGELTLADMIPSNLMAGDVAKVTSPTDLLALTKAVEVISVDYLRNQKAKAVVMGLKTLNKYYTHTKSICDRFRGATLLLIDSVNIKGFNFLRFALRQPDNSVEYAVAFVVGRKTGTENYTLQSNWLLSGYQSTDVMYNFQVWSTRPDYTDKLVADILTNLQASKPVVQVNGFGLPQAYITNGARVKEKLVVQVYNNTPHTNGKIVFDERVNETANIVPREIPVTLTAGQLNTIELPIHDGYEYEGKLYVNDSLFDEVYMADGHWGIDYDAQYTTITQFKPNNNFMRVYKDAEFPVYRSMTLKATSKDYITVYKALKAGTENADLLAYRSLKFYAKGTGTVEIRLIRDSITEYKNQYKTTVALDENGKQYAVSFDDFWSEKLSTPLFPKDVRQIVFSFTAGSGRKEEIQFFVDEIAFSKEVVPSKRLLQSKELSIGPNPTKGAFQCKFVSDEDRLLELTVSDITGKVIYTKKINAVTGLNSVGVELSQVFPRGYLLLVALKGKDVKYETQRVVVE